jgi:cytochrome c553
MQRQVLKLFVALLLLPPALSLSNGSLCGATDYWVKRNGCFYRVKSPATATAPSYSAGQAIAALAGKKAEWTFITESIAQLFGGSGLTAGGYSSDYSLQRGNTVYGHGQPGYSLQSFATVTTQPLDVEALMERATRLATQAQEHGAQATVQAQGLLGQAQAGQQAIAQTFAQAARELAVLEALQPITPQEVQTEVSATATASSGPAEAPVATVQALESWQPKFAAVVATKCSTCHDAESPAGGLNLAGDVAALDKDRLLVMLARVSTTDTSKRMPKDAEPLADADVLLFVKAFAAK